MHDSSRLIPYAKDHDRLQLALLCVESEIHRYEADIASLKALREEEEVIRKSLKSFSDIRQAKIKEYMDEFHPAEYVDSTGKVVVFSPRTPWIQNKGPKESTGRDEQTQEFPFTMEGIGADVLAAVLERIKKAEDAKIKYNERVAQREELIKSIEELYATAFDGNTPEFPHEDQLELLVEVAKIAVKGEQAALEKLDQDGLLKLEHVAREANIHLSDIFEKIIDMCEDLETQSWSLPRVYIIKEFWKINMIDQCRLAAQQCQTWKRLTQQYFDEHSDPLFSEHVLDKIPQFEAMELAGLFSRVTPKEHVIEKAKDIGFKLSSDAYYARAEIEDAVKRIEGLRLRAEKSVTVAEKVLELRRRQLNAARSQILDHVIDPNRCPVEQLSERLPGYPELVTIHGLSQFHPMVSRLLSKAETYSINAYVREIVQSRLSRIRRTTCPTALLPTRYQPPTYDELDDPDVFNRRNQIEVPPIDGEAPTYSEEPNYGGRIQVDANELTPIVQRELQETLSEARAQLGLGNSPPPADEVQTLIMSLVDMLGVGDRPAPVRIMRFL
ncbi:hypothetical protein RHS04_03805 [Rhizoctonia solani]|nr:hypothetical protein RHS04_03805 [Rhizoctonia solani]